MNVPSYPELMHMQLQAIIRDNDIPPDELRYLGVKEYSSAYADEYLTPEQTHHEYDGQMMHYYVIADEYEVPVCDIISVDGVDEYP